MLYQTPSEVTFSQQFSEQLSIGPFSKPLVIHPCPGTTALGTDPTANPHPTHSQARPDNRRDALNPLLLVQRHKPPPRQPRPVRHGLGPRHRRSTDERPSHPWKERSRSRHQEGRTCQHSPLGEEGRGHILRQRTLRTPLQERKRVV